MNAFVYHLTYEFKKGLRDRGLLLMIYLFPLVFYAMMGAIMTKINPFFAETMAPAMMVFAGMTAALLGLPSPMVSAREQGVYRSFRINGVPASHILIVPVLSMMVHLVIVSSIISLSAHPLFNGGIPKQWFAFAAITLLSALCSSTIGLLIGVCAANARIATLIAQFIFIPSTMLGGLMIPLDTLPANFRWLSMLFPATHTMNAFRGYAMNLTTAFNPLLSVVALSTASVLALTLATFLFSWDAKNEKKKPKILGFLALLPFIVVLLIAK
jgi:ABC-2 type transport system permease protein